MKFKIDENLPLEYAPILRAAGFAADTVADENLCGVADLVLAERTRSERRVLITLDLDFANIRSYPPAAHAGIVILRPRAQDKLALIALLNSLIPALKQASPEQQLWIVEEDRIRFRKG